MLPAATIDLGLHTYWYLGRAGGFVAFVLLLLSLLLGVAISSRIFDGLLARAWFFELHKFVSLFLLAAVLFHALVMLPDPYANYTLDELLIPFRSHIMPEATSIGVVSLYGLALISLSFYLTKWIGQKTWRLLHYATFLTYLAGVAHAIWAGTDSDLLGVRYFYLATAIALIFFVLYRILAVRSQKKLAVAKPAIREIERQVSSVA
jgi:predicted ferric reductase